MFQHKACRALRLPIIAVLFVLFQNKYSGVINECGFRGRLERRVRGDDARTLVVVLAFFNVDIVQASLDSIIHGQHGEPFGGDVVVVQQPSVHSTEMTNMLALRRKGNSSSGILRHILIDDSEPPVYGQAYGIPFLQNGIVDSNLYDVACISDGDVIMYGDWAQEVRDILEDHPEVFSVGVSLNTFNAYTDKINGVLVQEGPDRGDFIEANTGVQMVCHRTDELITMFHNISGGGMTISDSLMKVWIYGHGRIVARTKRNQLVHMMWSVYTEATGAHKEYLDLKNSQKSLWHSPRKADDIKVEVVF